jgi:hypothetical protein
MHDDYERLKQLTTAHDLAAAARLQRAAQRRADAPAEALAAAALGDVAALLQGGADAWSAGDWPRLLAFSDALGVPISASEAAHIDALCGVANARTPRRPLTHAHILQVLHEALASPGMWSTLHTGGDARNARCVVALAAFNPKGDAVTLGVGNSMRGAPSPRAAWPTALSSWRPNQAITDVWLAAWRDAEPDNQSDYQCVRLSRSVSGAHTLLRDTFSLTARDAWLRQARAALRSLRQPSGWLHACQLLQAAPGHDAHSADSARALALSDPKDLPRDRYGNRAWLNAALSLRDAAASHWRLTHALYLSNLRDPLLTSTCAAMTGLHHIELNHTATQSAARQARVFACLHDTPHLPHLRSLSIQGARLDAAAAHTLWGDPAILPTLTRLSLPGLCDAPAPPWPPLRRALDTLSLDDAGQPAPPLLRWLADAPASPKDLALRLTCRHPLSGPLVTLARTRSLDLYLTQSSDAAAICALLHHLALPHLDALTLNIPALTEATLDALADLRSRCDHDIPPALTLTIGHTRLYPWHINAGAYAPRPVLHPDLLARLRDEVLCDWELMYPA